jgi:protein MAK16
LTGLCSRHSCPLANARYATIREDKGQVYLYMKTIERAHLPNQLWEKVRLPRNYTKALAVVDEHLEFWSKFQRHKCKQRLTKLHQMIIRMRRLKVSDMHTQEEVQSINKRYEKRENKREERALIAAKLETAIEKELLNRLQKGTYKDIYNLKEDMFNEKLDEVEEKDTNKFVEEFESEDYDEEEESEEEMELNEEELAYLEAEEQADKNDIED